ncbi:MAG: hypothetical protein AB7Y46_02110 [Armatimonadota bacterium]
MTMRVVPLLMLLSAGSALAVPSLVEEIADGVYVVRDDTGLAWGGWSMGVSHMNSAKYQAKKILDLSDVPEDVWAQVREVRLSAFLMVRDYSGTQNPPANGLDEAFEVVVNGTVHTYPTSGGMPAWVENVANNPDWYDFALPKDEFVRGENEIILRKAPSEKNDDYLYLGIDNCEPRGNSSVTFDGEEWTQERLTVPGGNGEYMVRLYLIERELGMTARWRPGDAQPLDDPAGLILYAGAHGAEMTAEGVRLAQGQSARIEWRPGALDMARPIEATVRADGMTTLAWLDEAGAPFAAQDATGQVTITLPADRTQRTSGLNVTAREGAATLTEITLNATLSYHPAPEPIDMAPAITPVPPPAPPGPPSCTRQGDTAVLRNGWIEARFVLGERLRLASLRHELADVEMARSADEVALFVVEVGEKRYAGSRDFRLTGVEDARNGFVARLALDEPGLGAALTATIDEEGLRLGLELSNAGGAPLDFKLAFPHLAGLALADDPAQDYYYFPWGGGIIADVPAHLRGGYGDHQVLYQLIDLFAPERGVGLYLRVDDDEGWHKNLALRKHLPGRAEQTPHQLIAQVRPEFQWTQSSLPAGVTGTAVAVEYLRRTRAPGESFAPEPAVLAAHAGDWHVAMQRYADWAHRVWRFRPYPSRLHDVRNMIAAGWGTGYLFRDGAYRTDIIKPRTDCVELMSWWEWSELGPFSTPMDRLSEVMSEAEIERWKGYFVEDPVTGRKMWNNAPSDYRGYNERFGGLPAFRAAIQTYRELGAKLVTLYTDPFRLHDDCETGRAHGREWGVVGVDGEKTRAYLVWNPCHDLPAVREWIATELGRVMRETGADGIRLDEYGHRGWACYDESHKHTYAEWGITQWMKATAEATRMVHAAMDQVRPDLVLTTEHPGYDFLMQYLEGCITYDLTVLASPLRPLECNTQRFYFRECKAYELDHRNADPGDRKKFWNAVESFGRYYPAPFYVILSENEDAYQLGEAYPLLVTPGRAPQVYVNRFAAPGKTLYHLFNATGHTFEGEALAVPLAAGEHLFDLLACEEVEPMARADGLAGVRVYLPRDEVACIAQLTRRLAVTRAGDTLQVQAELPEGECTVVVANAQGDVLLEAPARAQMTVDLAQAPEGSAPACVKLLRDGQLVDAAAAPQAP